MKKLLKGIAEFKKNLTEEHRQLFAKLALGVSPDALLIACSDSRVVPNLFASTDPGDLFVLRNVGNLIPPYDPLKKGESVAAALEYAVNTLKVADIIVCGHSECAAMMALFQGVPCGCETHVPSWIEHARGALEETQKENITKDFHNHLSKKNVLHQMAHLASYPFVAEKLVTGTLRLHGWWFDIARAAVYGYDPSTKEFVAL